MNIGVRDYVRTTYGEIFKIIGMKRYKESIIYQSDTYNIVSEGVLENELEWHSRKINELIRSGDLIKFRIKNISNIYYGIAKNYKDSRSGIEKILVNGYSTEQIEVIKIYTKEQLEMTGYEVK